MTHRKKHLGLGFILGSLCTGGLFLLLQDDRPDSGPANPPASAPAARERRSIETPGAEPLPAAAPVEAAQVEAALVETVRTESATAIDPPPAPAGIPSAWIQGHVTDGRGRPLEGAVVTAKRQGPDGRIKEERLFSPGHRRTVKETRDESRTRSGKGGAFVVYGLEPGGRYELFINPKTPGPFVLNTLTYERFSAAQVTAPASDQRIQLPIGILRIHTVLPEARLRERDGTKVLRYEVNVSGDEMRGSGGGEMPEDIEVLVLTDRTFDLTVDAYGPESFRREGLSVPASTGELSVVAVLVPKLATHNTVEFDVRDASGRSIAGLRVGIVTESPIGSAFLRDLKIADSRSFAESGLCVFREVPAGRRCFVFEPAPASQLARLVRTFEIPKQGQVRHAVTLEPGGSLVLRVTSVSRLILLHEFRPVDRSGQAWWPPAVINLSEPGTVSGARTSQSGPREVQLLPGNLYGTGSLLAPGRYELKFNNGDESFVRTVAIAAGETTELEL